HHAPRAQGKTNWQQCHGAGRSRRLHRRAVEVQRPRDIDDRHQLIFTTGALRASATAAVCVMLPCGALSTMLPFAAVCVMLSPVPDAMLDMLVLLPVVVCEIFPGLVTATLPPLISMMFVGCGVKMPPQYMPSESENRRFDPGA